MPLRANVGDAAASILMKASRACRKQREGMWLGDFSVISVEFKYHRSLCAKKLSGIIQGISEGAKAAQRLELVSSLSISISISRYPFAFAFPHPTRNPARSIIQHRLVRLIRSLRSLISNYDPSDYELRRLPIAMAIVSRARARRRRYRAPPRS